MWGAWFYEYFSQLIFYLKVFFFVCFNCHTLLEQCLSNMHVGDLVKMQMLVQQVWGGYCESPFQASSQAVLMSLYLNDKPL